MTGRYYSPRAQLELDVPDWKSTAEDARFVQIYPRPIEVKWTRNHHLAADELTVSIGWEDGGVDPRMLKHARVSLWLWDEEKSLEVNKVDHLRFTGIVKNPERRLGDDGWIIDLACQDYTCMFIAMKPFPTAGMPEWTDTLRTAWQKICDNTGYYDPDSGRIVSSVKALRDNIVFDPPDLESWTLGRATSARFLEVARPTPKHGSDAWGVWQYCVCMLGLVSYIDRGQCVVTTTNEHFRERNAPRFLYGFNIRDFKESADTDISNTGILVKSFDPLKGRLIESMYPPPGDERIKKTRAQVKRATKESRDVSLNEASAQYQEFEAHWIHDQAALDRFAREAYEQFSRQEMVGSFHTGEMVVESRGEEVDILELMPGDCIYIGVHEDTLLSARMLSSEADRVEYLSETCGYDPELARLVCRNIDVHGLKSPVFHLESMEVHMQSNSFDIEIKFHNKVNLLPDNAAV